MKNYEGDKLLREFFCVLHNILNVFALAFAPIHFDCWFKGCIFVYSISDTPGEEKACIVVFCSI